MKIAKVPSVPPGVQLEPGGVCSAKAFDVAMSKDGRSVRLNIVDDRDQPLTDPVIEYTHGAVGIAVVGGYVYRGGAIPGLSGRYIFADYTRDFVDAPVGRGTLLAAEPQADDGAQWPWRQLQLRNGEVDRFVTGMGEDTAGELYVLTRTEFGPVEQTGEVLKLIDP